VVWFESEVAASSYRVTGQHAHLKHCTKPSVSGPSRPSPCVMWKEDESIQSLFATFIVRGRLVCSCKLNCLYAHRIKCVTYLPRPCRPRPGVGGRLGVTPCHCSTRALSCLHCLGTSWSGAYVRSEFILHLDMRSVILVDAHEEAVRMLLCRDR